MGFNVCVNEWITNVGTGNLYYNFVLCAGNTKNKIKDMNVNLQDMIYAWIFFIPRKWKDLLKEFYI